MLKRFNYLLLFLISVPIQAQTIDFIGASNTAGQGAQLSLEWRFKQHLQVHALAQGDFPDQPILVLLDYFYPSNFSAFGKAPLEELPRLVTLELQQVSLGYDTILVGILPEKGGIEKRSCRNDLKHVFHALDTRHEAVGLINQAIRDFVETQPQRFHLLDLTQFGNDFCNQHRNRAKKLFIVDGLHFNDYGQGHVFNLLLFPKLRELFPHFMILPIPENELKLSEESAQEFIQSQAKTLEQFKGGEEGIYWAYYEDLQDFVNSYQEHLSPDVPNAELKKDKKTLKKVAKKYAKKLSSLKNNKGLLIERTQIDGQSVMVLDLTQTLFFTKVILYPDPHHPGEYVGYGYDFWSSVSWTNPPFVNYVYRARELPENPNRYLSVTWKIFPLVFTDAERQPKLTGQRLGFVEEPWRTELQDRRGLTLHPIYPYVSFEYDLSRKAKLRRKGRVWFPHFMMPF